MRQRASREVKEAQEKEVWVEKEVVLGHDNGVMGGGKREDGVLWSFDEREGLGTDSTSRGLSEIDGTGWELALVTTPSNNTTHVVESKLAGGFDKLLLDSLYEDETTRRQIQLTNAGYGYEGIGVMQNPFQQQQHDPFIMSNHIAPPTNVQMALLAQQQQQYQQEQLMLQEQQQQQSMMMMVPYQYPQQQQMQQMSSSNPFGDPFSNLPPSSTSQPGNYTLL
ncbi:hypothetical protein REPUB_Repub03eG0144500 [Reevesia pubescens]